VFAVAPVGIRFFGADLMSGDGMDFQPASELRNHAVQIWHAGVAAVDSKALVQSCISVDADALQIGLRRFSRNAIRHIEVLGAGKAGAGMAQGLHQTLTELVPEISLSGWLNVPADCVRDCGRIHLHAARPAGLNEPTNDAVRGTGEILQRAARLGSGDLCLVLLSGGGSALLCLPVPEISLEDKLAVTRALARAGAPIHDLNAVRTQLSRVKGGRLANACRAEELVTLIISDVVGDPLSVIASGPTFQSSTTAADALRILEKYELSGQQIPASVWRYLSGGRHRDAEVTRQPECIVTNHIIGNNQTALNASRIMAESLGYEVVSLGSANQGEAAAEGRDLFTRLHALKRHQESLSDHPGRGAAQSLGIPERGSSWRGRRYCLLSGGEPTVRLTRGVAARKGGRNQELVLAAVAAHNAPEEWRGIVLVSGGTDGEDGPTDAAGAVADEFLVQQAKEGRINADDFLAINNSYPFFQMLNGLLITGPTHTNVMDLRVGLAVVS
jgi:glycerate 2-kinase